MSRSRSRTNTSRPDAPSRHGVAPWREALRRLLRNKLAMLGATMTLLIVVPVIFAPWLCALEPTDMRPWLNARPPGFTHPDVLLWNRFAVGSPPETTAAIATAKTVTLLIDDAPRESYRLVLRRGKLSQIQQTSGAQALTELSLDRTDWDVAIVPEAGASLPYPTDAVLRLGEPPPPGLFAAGQQVTLIECRPRDFPPATCTIELADGKVTAIRRQGESLPRLDLPGDRVLSVEADGSERTITHLLGTDAMGRDVFARVLYGGRISLLVGLVATLVSLLIGVAYGAISGYAGGRTDTVMMSGVDILYAIPFMFLVILLMVSFGQDILVLFMALGAVQWLTMSRIVRGQVLSLKQKEFVEAARMAGAKPLRIVFRHLVPNTLGPVIVYTTLTVPIVILQESFLAFIGLSVQYQGLNLDSWGALVLQGVNAQDKPWLLLAPSVAMVMALLGLNCLGDGLRDVLDPRLDNA